MQKVLGPRVGAQSEPGRETGEKESKSSWRRERKDRAKTKTFVATLGWPGRHRDHDNVFI